MKNQKHLPLLRLPLILIAGFSFTATLAAPPEPGPIEVDVVNNPDVTIANGPTNPIPVSVVGSPETSVLCYKALGGLGVGGPFANGGASSFATSLVTCPIGVEKIDIQRLAFTPDIGGTGSTRNVAKFRVTVNFSDVLGDDSPAGFLAMLTEGAPEASAAQNFRLDTTDTTKFITATEHFTSGIDAYEVSMTGTLYFIGTPVP